MSVTSFVLQKKIKRYFLLFRHLPTYSRFIVKLRGTKAGRIFWNNFPVSHKKFAGEYLSTSITPKEKIIIQTRNIDIYANCFINVDISDGLDLWSLESDGGYHKIVLLLAKKTAFEGEFCLQYRYRDKILHLISFSFSPGKIFKTTKENVVFVGGSQGIRDGKEIIKEACKENGGILPANMVLCSLKALSKYFSIESIYCVLSENHAQNFFNETPALENYDKLWEMNNGVKTDLFYVLPTTKENNESKEISGHKSRYRKRRKIKDDVYDQSLMNISTKLEFKQTNNWISE